MPARRQAAVETAPDRVDVEEFLTHPRPTRAQRRADGKALRAEVPLDAHAEVPDASVRDAVAVLRAQDDDRVQALLPLRYERTSADPFAFLRGSAAVMAGDLATLPRTAAVVQLCGDAHVANFGLFASPDRRLMFDVNDFDETMRGPFEWDVKRLAASVAVAARTIGMGDKRARRSVRHAVASYRGAMASLAATPTLDLWYLRVDADDLTRRLVGTALERAATKAGRKARRNTGDVAVDRMTRVADGGRVFRDEPPVLSPISSADAAGEVGALYARYLDSLPLDCAVLLARYSFRGAAHRVVGVGSVGTRCLLMLLESGDGEPLMLQLKQAGPSVLEAHLGASRFGRAHGRRVVAGQRLMQAAGDPFLGWADAGPELAHDYYTRQLRDMKGSIDAASLDEEALDLYGRVCGGVLARAHARSGDASLVAGYLGSSDAFDVAVAEFAMAYAGITADDHAALVAAMAQGDVPGAG